MDGLSKEIKKIAVLLFALGMTVVITVLSGSKGICAEGMIETEERIVTEEKLKSGLRRVSRIILEDAADGMYEFPLEEKLSEEETEKIRSNADLLGLHEGSLRMIRYYRLILMDPDGDIVDEWMVDASHNVITKEGSLAFEKTFLTKWLEELEQAHGVDLSLLSRAPGENYFAFLPLSFKGHLSERTVNRAAKGTEYDLTDEDISVLSAIGSTILTKADRNEDIDVYYILNIYDENGAELYSFSADHDGKYYCNRYPVYGEEIEAFFRSLEEENGL